MSDSQPDRSICDRVAVIGASGSGKTVFAQRLSLLLSIPHVELDDLYWGPKWTPRPEADFRADVAATAARERWIIAGNYASVRELVWPRATTVAWLNYSLSRVMSRLVRRTARRIVTRQRLVAGNRETLRGALASRDSILWWVLKTHGLYRRTYGELRRSDAFGPKAWAEFQTPGHAERFLSELRPLR